MTWTPPERFGREDLVRISERVLAEPDIEIVSREEILTVEAGGLEWDVVAMVHEPKEPRKVPLAPDGRKIGFMMTHGGASDWRTTDHLAELIARKRGAKVVNMTFPGRLYFDDPSRNWPDDTFHADGTVRTPIWKRGEHIGPDQYEIVSEAKKRHIYGTRSYARALPGTIFHDRMATWPLAMEAMWTGFAASEFPQDEWAVHLHGHSTGGPMSHMALQRIPNAVGITGIENSPYGEIFQKVSGHKSPMPYTDLLIRTWRELARYRGAEAALRDGEKALMSLAALMEDIHAEWDRVKVLPQFKAEFMLHIGDVDELTAMAEAVAKRLGLDAAGTAAMVQRYLDLARPMSGPGVKPVPPLLYIICKFSRDHSPEAYRAHVLPAYEHVTPKPPTRLVEFGTGVHGYWIPEAGLPEGCCPAAIDLFFDAIHSGYYTQRKLAA